jgi:hypothetical protein
VVTPLNGSAMARRPASAYWLNIRAGPPASGANGLRPDNGGVFRIP